MAKDFSRVFEADGMTFEVPTDMMFNFNNPVGACPTCEGFGKVMGIDERLVIPNNTLSIYDNAVACWRDDKDETNGRKFSSVIPPNSDSLSTSLILISRRKKKICCGTDLLTASFRSRA